MVAKRRSGTASPEVENRNLDSGVVSPESWGLVGAAVAAELESMPSAARVSSLAALALALAGEVDAPGNSATSKSMCARALMDALSGLRALVPEERAADGVDDLAAARAVRLERVAKA